MSKVGENVVQLNQGFLFDNKQKPRDNILKQSDWCEVLETFKD